VESSPGSGTLSQFGNKAVLPAPVWNVTPPPPPAPGLPPPPPVVQAVVAPEPPQAYEFGDAMWVKVFVTELPEALRGDDLDHMVVDDPAVHFVPHEPAEVEVEWVRMQADSGTPASSFFDRPVGAAAKAVSRRFEFYKYVGDYDPETHEALCQDPALCPDAVGDLIGAQNVAVNLVEISSRESAADGRCRPGPARVLLQQGDAGRTASSDPNGDALTYQWTLVTRPSGAKPC